MSKNNDENELMLQVVKAHTKRETPGKGGRGGFTSVTDMQVTMDPIFEFRKLLPSGALKKSLQSCHALRPTILEDFTKQ